MTTMTTSVSRPVASGRRCVPWSRLAWVTWRQHRVALAGVIAVLGVAGVYLLIMGLEVHSAYDRWNACRPAGSAACVQLRQAFESFYGSQQGSVTSSGINAQTVPFLLLALPVLLGIFFGAPVVARELESGTFRFAWTQGCGRLRWAVTKLVVLAVALTAIAYAFSVLFGWYISPFVASGKTGEFPMQLFGNLGVAFAAWTLLAFAMSAFAGALIRRVVPAMAATLVVWTVLDVTTMMAIRQHYMTPLTVSGANQPSGNSWVLSQVHNAWLYQPGNRFWPFQLIEGGWLLALSAILIGATVWLVRRRAA